MFVPLLLPTKNRILQLNLFGVFVCLACGRALNVLEPRQFGIVLDRMSAAKSDVHVTSTMSEVVVFVLYRWIDAVLMDPAKDYFGRLSNKMRIAHFRRLHTITSWIYPVTSIRRSSPASYMPPLAKALQSSIYSKLSSFKFCQFSQTWH